MKKKTSIQLKALFLFVVFAANTIIGFACSIGVNMGYNAHHHESEEMQHSGDMHSKSAHHHESSKSAHHHETSTTEHQHQSKESSKDDCCSNEITSFNNLSKTVPQTAGIVHPVFAVVFVAAFFNIGILPYNNVVKDIKPFVRSHHPPIPDIRIAIQSFQI